MPTRELRQQCGLVFMVLAQSAATAAALAIDAAVAVQDVSYARLRERLLKDRQILEYSAAAGGAREPPSPR